ncbi:MAG: endonuclease domain-containing protein [Anaerolineae bacterium]
MRLKNEDYWDISPELATKMLEVARVFRKEPTPSEEILWQALRSRQLAGRKFRRQVPIGSFIVDFFCASERLVIEIDGLIHESQRENDRLRQEMIESLEIRFVRIPAYRVEHNLSEALITIQSAFNNR